MNETKIKNVRISEAAMGPEDAVCVNLEYPNINEVKHIEINQESVRASDGIRCSYDYDRDGWKIEQPQRLSWDMGDGDCDPLWVEVAFVQSWGSHIEDCWYCAKCGCKEHGERPPEND